MNSEDESEERIGSALFSFQPFPPSSDSQESDNSALRERHSIGAPPRSSFTYEAKEYEERIVSASKENSSDNGRVLRFQPASSRLEDTEIVPRAGAPLPTPPPSRFDFLSGVSTRLSSRDPESSGSGSSVRTTGLSARAATGIQDKFFSLVEAYSRENNGDPASESYSVPSKKYVSSSLSFQKLQETEQEIAYLKQYLSSPEADHSMREDQSDQTIRSVDELNAGIRSRVESEIQERLEPRLRNIEKSIQKVSYIDDLNLCRRGWGHRRMGGGGGGRKSI